MNKKNVLILQGGNNEEHEISLSTAKEVKKAIIELNHNVLTIDVNPINFHKQIIKYKIDICFNALHGPFGEDGNIQKILYDNNITYTHSGVQSSTIGFNKFLTKKELKKTSVNFLKSILFNKNKLNNKKLLELLNKLGAFVLKPISSGSSYGVQIIRNKEDIDYFYENYLINKDLYLKHEIIMAEPYIEGKELTVTVIENNKISKAVEVTEIYSNNLFFDYQAKYSKGFAKHILPAKIPKDIYDKCLSFSKIAHDTIGCRGISRSDFIYDQKSNNIFFLEINTQPGLTSVSLVPEQLKYHNISFHDLINKLLFASSCQS